jgi:hypothetical protein
MDSFTDLFKTHILFSVMFIAKGTIHEIMRNTLYRHTVERLHYTRNASRGFVVLDN